MIIVKKLPAHGDKRVVRKFCWLPFFWSDKTTRTVVWWRTVEITEKYFVIPDGVRLPDGWGAVSVRVLPKHGEEKVQ